MEEVSIMNEPIISPWLFYFIDMLSPLQFLLCLVIFVCVTTYFGYTVCRKDAYLRMNSYRDGGLCSSWILEAKEEIKSFDAKIKVAKVVGIISLILALFIPSKETAYKMFIAYHVTPANVQMTEDMVDKSIDKVIEKIINYQKKLEEKK